ncbi:unnamed protein product [Cyprideis torosa]|uniref:4-hydroxy-2-oxoglutarate aldolase, mitochondrial n=1 Tax=Cyprideis torosa TaxID=163714 RepID=A0A7R8WQK5_9CRUS|nr:unnamed protein product [Cyprideis torosa]CAG0902768.1 unnamed protein product [Cyprideis torosa]
MNGAGNDFLLIDHRQQLIAEDRQGEFVRQVCRRRFSVGADGVFFIEEDDDCDFRWRFYNADGSLAEMCGNGARCAARFAYHLGLAPGKMRFSTLAGVIEAEICGDDQVRIRMTQACDLEESFVLELEGDTYEAGFINTGVPHVVIFTNEIDLQVQRLGRMVRHHTKFSPRGTNVNFVSDLPDGRMLVRTYERGVEEETMACGTGAVATALLAWKKRGVTSPAVLVTSGGEELAVEWRESSDNWVENVYLKGPARFVYTGELMAEALLVDERSFVKLIEFQLEQGIHGIVPCGTTGESATLDFDEHKQVIELAVKTVKGRVPVIAGTGANSTLEAIELTESAKKSGADAVLSVVPYYNKPSQEGMYEHFKAVAEAVDIPVFLYNVPSRTVVNMAPETVARLAEIDTIRGIKEACGNMEQVSDLIRLCPDDFTVLSGDDFSAMPTIALGGQGVISVVSNIDPAGMAAMMEAALAGKTYAAAMQHYRLLPLMKLMFATPSPGPAKIGLEMMEKIVDGAPRLPVTGPDAKTTTKIREAMAALGLLMGKMIGSMLLQSSSMTYSAAFEAPGSPGVGQDALLLAGGDRGLPIVDNLEAVIDQGDVIIDFTFHQASVEIARTAAKHGCPLVIGTTGMTKEELAELALLARSFPCVHAPNMSICVNLLFKLVEKTAALLGQEYDIEIVEAHHKMKKDAPSGTALKLGELAAKAVGQSLEEVGVFSREGIIGERKEKEIGIQSIRAADIVGEHTVFFAGPGERIELTHRAHSREHFAKGALSAAAWVVGKPPGIYSMFDVLGLHDF